jgi:hypothetical protein
MIQPSAELARWDELWRLPQAAAWIQNSQERAVAAFVRAEHRCSRKRPSPLARSEVKRLRSELEL